MKLIVIIIIGVFCAFLLVNYFSKNINPFFMAYAEDEVERITNLVINDSINNDIIEEFDDNKIFEIVRSTDGEIQLISYNAKNVNILLNNIAMIIQDNLKALEMGEFETIESYDYLNEYDSELLKQGIICEIPFGAFSNSSLISNVGPKMPVMFNLLGNVSTDLKTNVKEYGINNALLEVSIKVSVNVRVNLPFISDKINVSSTIPISMKIIQGSIPDFYTGGFTNSYGRFTE